MIQDSSNEPAEKALIWEYAVVSSVSKTDQVLSSRTITTTCYYLGTGSQIGHNSCALFVNWTFQLETIKSRTKVRACICLQLTRNTKCVHALTARPSHLMKAISVVRDIPGSRNMRLVKGRRGGE